MICAKLCETASPEIPSPLVVWFLLSAWVVIICLVFPDIAKLCVQGRT